MENYIFQKRIRPIVLSSLEYFLAYAFEYGRFHEYTNFHCAFRGQSYQFRFPRGARICLLTELLVLLNQEWNRQKATR